MTLAAWSVAKIGNNAEQTNELWFIVSGLAPNYSPITSYVPSTLIFVLWNMGRYGFSGEAAPRPYAVFWGEASPRPYQHPVISSLRHFLSILLLPLVFTSTVIAGFDVHELEKLGNVVLHYQHHISDHGETDLSFVEYLVDHFSASASHEDQQHKGLPLVGSGHFCSTHILPTTDTPILELHIPVIVVFILPADASPDHAPVFGRIFQPPRS